MEIHVPEGEIHSVKQFLLHLLTITIGILIALGLESTVQAMHHRSMVREAERNLAAEILQNQRELTRGLQQLGDTEGQLRSILKVTQARKSGANIPPQLNLGWSLAELHSTSWDTAHSTGAVAFMDSDTVAQYTELYDRQKQFLVVQERGLEASLDLNGRKSAAYLIYSGELTNAELHQLQAATVTTLVDAVAVQQMGKVLLENYGKFTGTI